MVADGHVFYLSLIFIEVQQLPQTLDVPILNKKQKKVLYDVRPDIHLVRSNIVSTRQFVWVRCDKSYKMIGLADLSSVERTALHALVLTN